MSSPLVHLGVISIWSNDVRTACGRILTTDNTKITQKISQVTCKGCLKAKKENTHKFS